MRRSNYAIISCLNDLVSLSAFFWLFAGTVSIGVASHLPEKHFGSYTIAVSAILLIGVWQQSLRPVGKSHRGLSITTVKRVLNWLSVIRILAGFDSFCPY